MDALTKPRLTALAMLVTASLALLVHWPGLSSQAVSLDDGEFLTNNYLVTNPSLDSVLVFFGEVLEPSTVGGYYTPLTMTSLMVDCGLGGSVENLLPFHRTNILLHALNGALLVLLLTQLFRRPWVACLVGALFVAHPLTVEPVTWISERKTLLATVFALASLVSYVKSTTQKERTWFFAALIFYLLSLLSKPTTLALPLLFVLVDVWPLGRFRWSEARAKLPFFALAGGAAIITLVSHGNTGAVRMSGLQAPLLACRSLGFYVAQTLWPTNLTSHYYIREPLSFSDPYVLWGVVGVVLCGALLVASWRRTKMWVVGVLFFVLAIFPTLGFVRYSWVLVSDKYVYFPIVGILLPVTAWLARAWDDEQARTRRRVLVSIAVILVAAETVGTRSYLAKWATTDTLYRHMSENAPESARAKDYYGNTLLDAGRTDEAMAVYQEGLAIDPEWTATLTNVGCVLYEAGSLDEAIVMWERAIRSDPTFAEAHVNLAIGLAARGDQQAAMGHLEEALQHDSKNKEAHNTLGILLLGRGEVERARQHFETAIDCAPDFANAHVNLGVVLGRSGEWQAAVGSFRAGLKWGAPPIDVHQHLGGAYMNLGDWRASQEQWKSVLALDPENAAAWNNSATISVQLGEMEAAERQARRAVELKADYVDAGLNLAVILHRRGELTEALQRYIAVLALDPSNAAALRGRDAILNAK